MKLPKHKDLTIIQRKIYNSLSAAKQRCTDKNDKLYHRYGGRGIKYLLEENKRRIQVVLEQELAYRAAMAMYPNEKIVINRKDNDGDYVEDNTEWTTPSLNTKQMHRDNPNVWRKGQLVAKPERPVIDCRGNWFKSASEVERLEKIDQGNVSRCCYRKLKSAGKYEDGTPRVWGFA